MELNQSAFPEVFIGGDSCIVIRKMVTYIPKKPFRVLIGNTDDGYSGLLTIREGFIILNHAITHPDSMMTINVTAF